MVCVSEILHRIYTNATTAAKRNKRNNPRSVPDQYMYFYRAPSGEYAILCQLFFACVTYTLLSASMAIYRAIAGRPRVGDIYRGHTKEARHTDWIMWFSYRTGGCPHGHLHDVIPGAYSSLNAYLLANPQD